MITKSAGGFCGNVLDFGIDSELLCNVKVSYKELAKLTILYAKKERTP
jgi:hypothetical protein